jgi:hypothetical protein
MLNIHRHRRIPTNYTRRFRSRTADSRFGIQLKKFLDLASKGRPAKNLNTKSARPILSCRVTWAWSGGLNLYNGQIKIQCRNSRSVPLCPSTKRYRILLSRRHSFRSRRMLGRIKVERTLLREATALHYLCQPNIREGQ